MMIRPVENWHCEAERIRRTQELHQRRLKSIETETSRRLKEIKDPSKRLTKTAPRVQSDWVSRDPADHRRTYAHIRGGRAGVDSGGRANVGGGAARCCSADICCGDGRGAACTDGLSRGCWHRLLGFG